MDDDQTPPTPASPADSLPPFVRGLMQPSAYPHAPASVRLVQTHISYVWIADDLVYKAKKPVDFGFINQVDAKTREAFCHLEVELNRRLAPDVYLEVVPILQRADGTFATDCAAREGDTVLEWAVKMRRLPDDRSLDQLLAADAVPADLVERLTRKLVAFHIAARSVEYDPAFAGVEAERAWWAREYREAEGNIGSAGIGIGRADDGRTWRPHDAATLRDFVARMLDEQADLFNERLAAGRVVEGHGDLHAKHVYVLTDESSEDDAATDGIAIVDCIEFTEWFHFRYLDVGYDIAFLAMDLEARGQRALGDEIAGRYIATTADETMGVLQPLHRAFRAFVRGKVESIGANDAGMDAAQRYALAESAAGYFRLAARYAERQSPPALVVLCGLSGTGKTSVGGVLAGRIGAALVSTDAVRAEVATERGLSMTMWQQYEAGAYSPEMNAAVYDEMRRRAQAHLQAGRAVILDGTHRRATDRTAALAIARELGVPSLVVELRLPEADALQRLRDREAARGTTPDEDAYRRHVEEFEMASPAEGTILALDATQPLVTLAEEIEDALGRG